MYRINELDGIHLFLWFVCSDTIFLTFEYEYHITINWQIAFFESNIEAQNINYMNITAGSGYIWSPMHSVAN